MHKNILVVFSGYNQRAVVAFLRVLSANRVCDYVIIASSDQDMILHTKYVNNVFCIRKKRELDKKELFGIFKEVKDKYKNKQLIIPPTTEALNRFFLEYEEELAEFGCIVPLVKKGLYESISDKEKFCELCRKSGFEVPQSLDWSEEFDKPYVAKPKKYFAQDGNTYSPVLVHVKEEHDDFLMKYRTDDFIRQEYISGDSYYLLYYFSRKGDVHSFSQVNFAQQPEGKSIIAAASSEIHKEKIAGQYVSFLKKMRFYGFIMIELRKNKDMWYMIEANPRFWGPSQLFVDAGVPFFEVFLNDYGMIDTVPKKKDSQKVKYLWSGGYVDHIFETDSCIWLGNGKSQLMKNWEGYRKADLYRREDTMKIYEIEELKKMYMHVSKHSNYQVLPEGLACLLDQKQLQVKSRQEYERLEYILKHVEFKNKKILDIGGNTGFFTFKAIDNGAEIVEYYEGNKVHAQFVNMSANIMGVKDRIRVHSKYYLFQEQTHRYDIILNLNVLHHLGDDFEMADNKEKARREMLNCINRLAMCTDIMVFQMGFNWKGDPGECLFEHGLKCEMEQYLEEGTKEYWTILHTGIAVMEQGKVGYRERNMENNIRQDHMGEFLNRPVFIMKSLKG